MPSKNSLESHGIELHKGQNCDNLSDCPSQLTDFFKIILNIRWLDINRFGGSSRGNHSIHPTPPIQREAELKLEAIELSRICSDEKRHTDHEDSWIHVQQSIVFYRFDREAEEIYTRNRHHHCFQCNKHFPFRSRPLAKNTSPRLFEHKVQGVYGSDNDSHDADLCHVHSNISHFEMGKVAYMGYDGEGKRTPDLTIGLLSWSRQWYPPPGSTNMNMEEIMNHRLVRPFKRSILEEHLTPIFSIPSKAVCELSIAFPFIIWEAKKEGGDSLPVVQNAVKVKMILDWQKELANKAKIAWEPLVFHFVSVGSDWKLYACHIKALRGCAISYKFRLLWSGDCAEEASALQLLCLVDIIALWGQFQYKPFAGTSVRILQGERRRRSRASGSWSKWGRNLLEDQKPIDAKHFRWLHLLQESNNDPQRSIFRLPRLGTFTSKAEVERQIEEGLRQLSLKDYFIPEKDGFIWLSYHGSSSSDLVVLRVNNEGRVLPPLLIYSSADWKSPDFLKIVSREGVRMPRAVQTDFLYDQNGVSVWQRCFDPGKGYCTEAGIQFCAVIPLEYNSPRKYLKDFRSLERKLGIETLVDNLKAVNEEWCTCNSSPEKGNMILCDSAKCKVGWYHKECAGLDDGDEANIWICGDCQAESTHILLDPGFNYAMVEKDILDRSDMRIHRTRNLFRAWNTHAWPNAMDIRRSFNHISAAIELESRESKFKDTVETLENEMCAGSWAILRDDPRRMTRVCSRFRATQE